MHKYTYYRNRSAEQTNHLILFIVIVAFLPLSRTWIEKKRTGNYRENSVLFSKLEVLSLLNRIFGFIN